MPQPQYPQMPMMAHAPDDAPAPVPADAHDGPRPALHGPAHVRGGLPHRPAEPDQDEEQTVPAELRHGGPAPGHGAARHDARPRDGAAPADDDDDAAAAADDRGHDDDGRQ